MAVIGIDLGGTKLASSIFSEEGSMGSEHIVALEKRRGEDAGALVAREIESRLEEAASEGLPIDAIGVSVPGIYYERTGRVWAPNIPEWENYPLLDELIDVVGADVHIEIDSDRACYILGEAWQGCARGCRDAIFMAVGTGIGAGILVDGHVLRGHSDIAGAIGWLALDRPFRNDYIASGCFESQASGAGLAHVARRYLKEDGSYSGLLRRRKAAGITAVDVFQALDEGDEIATAVLDNAIQLWGMAAANLVSLFNPEMIVFGGGVFGPAARFIDRIREEALLWGQPISMKEVKFEVSRLGGKAGIYGAAKLAFQAIDTNDQ